MDKIDFARIASFFAEKAGRSLSFDELRILIPSFPSQWAAGLAPLTSTLSYFR